jgi:hypothetical protein
MNSSPLIVPVAVQAMVLNNTQTQFVRNSMDYAALESFSDPSPGPFTCDPTDFGTNPESQGVYVLWTLPKALRHGQQQPGGAIGYPFVPNRWLVVRLYRPADAAGSVVAPQSSAWIVQSDVLNGTAGVSYVDPTQPESLTPTTLGGFTLITADTPWQEPANPGSYFLTAVSDGNPEFAAYQPFNQNVFSFFDPLATQDIGAGVVSYFVLGWYSDPQADVLAAWPVSRNSSDVAAFLSGMNWTAAVDGTGVPVGPLTSVYQGSAGSVPWNPGAVPPTSPKDGIVPGVAVGNTSIDAVVAFARAALASSNDPTPDEAAEVLEAFQYNVLPLLATPGGEALLEQRVRQQWFSSTHAGTSWTIVDAPVPPGAQGTSVDAVELEREGEWLANLNDVQALIDLLQRELLSVQRRLFELWWKQGAGSYFAQVNGDWPWNTSEDQFQTGVQTLSAQALTLQTELTALLSQVPTPLPGGTLAQAITEFALAKSLPSSRLLQPVAQPRFWSAADPVVILSNTAHMLHADSGSPLPCRWLDQVLTSLNISVAPAGPAFTVTTDQLQTWQPAVPYANLPAITPALFQEFFLLDTGNAALLAAAAGEQLTADQLTAVAVSMASPSSSVAGSQPPGIVSAFPWQQPWQPLFLDWEVSWYPIPFQQADGTANWSFDGSDYVLSDDFVVPSITPLSFSGRSILTPKPSVEFQARIGQYIDDYPGSPVAQLLQQIQSDLTWDFVSQRLSGLESMIAQWNPVAVQQPDASLQSLIGDAASMPPNPQQATGQRFETPDASFEGLRAGQFFINQMTVVDAWGQTLDVVVAPVAPDTVPRVPLSDSAFEPLTADGLTPSGNLPVGPGPGCFIEMPPRILQPARLNFLFTPQQDGNPILGWMLPNHLDSALSIYDGDGGALGEMILGVDANDQQVVNWLPAPGSTLTQLPSSAPPSDPLSDFLVTLQAQGAAALTDFLTAVDETLWTVNPLGGGGDAYLSVLIGRPLAIVAATVSLELQEKALTDTDWPFTFAPVTPPFLGYKFPVRLGDLGYQQDGLLGYFSSGDFSTFNAVHVPDSLESDYLAAVAQDNYLNLSFAAQGPGPETALVMIMDPRGSVHAQCGFLPVKEVTLVPQWVDDALARMVVTFRTGPALVESGQTPAVANEAPVPGILLPQPAERAGTWSWVESSNTPGQWNQLALLPVDGTAQFPGTSPTLREGRLTLDGAIATTLPSMFSKP